MSFKNKKKILIVEPFHTGHHISLYLRNLFEEFERQNISINILTSLSTYQSEVFKEIEKDIDIENIFLLRETAEPKNQNYLSILFYEIKWWLIIKKEFLKIKKLHKFEKIYLTSVDFIHNALAIFGNPFKKTSFSTLFVSPKHHFVDENQNKRRFSKLRNFLFSRILNQKNLSKIYVIDINFYEFFQKKKIKNKHKIEYVPDFGSLNISINKQNARKNIGLSNSDFVILVYGSISSRKGLLQLVESAIKHSLDRQVKIIIAGKIEKKLFETYKNSTPKFFRENNIVERFFFHSEFQEGEVFSASDCVWLGYSKSHIGSSGVLYQSAIGNLPSISTNHGLIGRLVSENKIGILVNPDNPEEINSAIKKLSEDKALFENFKKNCETFSKNNNLQVHMSKITKSLLN